MPERLGAELSAAELAEHPAVIAWRGSGLGRGLPAGVQVLHKTRKSAAFRLEGAGWRGEAVIAKRTGSETAQREHAIYSQILPNVPLAALRSYGLVHDTVGGDAWLFLEDAGGRPLDLSRNEDRSLAGLWLGTLHGASASLAGSVALPGTGQDYYLQVLRLSRERLVAYRDAMMPAGLDADRGAYVVERIDLVEKLWDRVSEVSCRFPRALAHGDFAPKNMRVRCDDSSATLYPFDWEHAGWGVPGPDLVHGVDGGVYLSAIRPYWAPRGQSPSASDISLLMTLGEIFRAVACIYWQLSDLPRSSGDASWTLLNGYADWMVREVRVLDAGQHR